MSYSPHKGVSRNQLLLNYLNEAHKVAPKTINNSPLKDLE